MGKKIINCFLISIFAILAMGACPREAAAEEKYTIVIPVVQGLSVGSLSNIMKDMASVISRKTGYDIQIKEISYKKGEDDEVFLNVLKAMKGGAQFGLVQSPLRYIKYEKQAAEVMASAFTMLLNNKKQSFTCGYVRKSSPYKSAADLKGKTYGGLHTMEARAFLHGNGIDSSMKDFFGKSIFVDDTTITAPFDALLSNKIDVHITLSYIGQMALNASKKYADGVREFGCTEYEQNWIFFYKKGTNKTVVDKLTSEMLKANTDKDYAQFKFMLTAIKGKFVPFEPKDLKKTRELAALVAKYGWDKEEKEFLKNKPK